MTDRRLENDVTPDQVDRIDGQDDVIGDHIDLTLNHIDQIAAGIVSGISASDASADHTGA